MGFRYPVPDDQQIEQLRKNGMDPNAYFVKYVEKDGTLYLQCYKTGDEITVRPNPLKRRI